MSMPTSTTSSSKPESGFSYAAAASGKQKATATITTMAPAPVDGPTDQANTTEVLSNGHSTTQPEQSTDTTAISAVAETVEPTMTASSANGVSANEERDGPIAEEKQNGWEKQSEASSGQTPEAPKPKEFVPAPAPAVNVWKVRQEAQAAKTKVSPAPAATSSTPVSPETVGTATTATKSMKDVDSVKKKGAKSTGPNTWDQNKTNGGEKSNSREQRDRKKAEPTKDKAANGAAREDGEGKPRTGKPPKSQAQTAAHIPSITDARSWPTPENAKDEKEKKVREESREKPAASSKSDKQSWIRMEVEPAVYNGISPKASRGGRTGRGGNRGGFESSKGASAQKYSGDGTASGADNERGRTSQGEKPSRGGHFGGRGGKRATSAGNGPNRKASHTHGSEPRREEATSAQPNTNGAAEAGSASTDNKPSTEKPSSQSSPKASGERSERQQAFGVAPVLPVNSSGNPNFEANPLRERNANGGRGGYRSGRGNNHYNGAANGGHQTGPTSASTQTFPGNYQTRSNYQMPRGQRVSNPSYPRYSPMQPLPTTYQMHSYPAHYDINTGVPIMGAHMHAEQSFDSEYIKGKLIQQVDYYFCIDNLCKDMFLRKHMDSEGFVKLSFIANFARVKTLTQSYEQLKDAVLSSKVLEVATSPNGEGIRRKADWKPWVRAPEDRDVSATGTPGPWTILAEKPATETHQTFPQGAQMMNGYVNGYHGEQGNGHVASNGYAGGNWYPAAAQNAPVSVEKQNGLSAEVPSFTPKTKVSKQSAQPDVYPDSALDALVIVCTRAGVDAEQKSRPTPNGFLNGEAPASRYHPISNADSDFAGASSNGTEESKTSLGWIEPNAEHDSTIPIPAGSVHRAYTAFKTNVLQQRKEHGNSAEMAILYRFWRHFLLCHFNRSTYFEFRQYAMEDNRAGSTLGFNYYLGYLKYVHLAQQQPPLIVTNDLVDLAKDYESANDVLSSVIQDSAAATKAQIEGRLEPINAKAKSG